MKRYFQLILSLLCNYYFPLFSQECCLSSFPSDNISDSLDLQSFEEKIKYKDQEETVDISQLELPLSAECEPLTTVAGCVNVCSGQFFQVEKDLTSEAIEPLSVVRTYDSGNNSESFLGYGFGLQFPLLASDMQKGARHQYVMISEREGFLLPYRSKEGGFSNVCSIDPRVLKKGYTNTSRGASGHANFINWIAIYQKNQEHPEGKWIVYLGDGSKRTYSKFVKMKREDQRRLDFPTKEAYLLEEERKPNGNRNLFSYKYIHEKPRLTQVKVVNRDRSATLDELNFSYSSDRCIVTNLYGDSVEYVLKEAPCLSDHISAGSDRDRKVLQEVKSSQNGEFIYQTKKEKGNRKICRVKGLHNRFLEIHYDEAKRNNESDKVKCIIEPCGSNNETIKTYQFHYHQNDTEVWDALNNFALYHFDDNKRLSRIDYFDSDKELLRQEAFGWSHKEGEEGWLRAKSIQIDDQIFYLKTYRYDQRGNIQRTTLYGNLTGEKAETFRFEKRTEMDSYFIECSYTDDERNLLTKKKTSEGLEIIYDYLPKTNLCIKTLQSYDGRIQERTFREYDENSQVIKIIEDNGSSQEDASNLSDATFRKIKVIERYKNTHLSSFGKPFQEIDYYQNLFTGDVIQLSRKEFLYDAKGRENQQRVYSNNTFCYEVKKEYNARGQLVMQTDPMGYITEYEWDKNNKIKKERLSQPTESGIRKIKSTSFAYDEADRLKKKTEKHNHGNIFETIYSYNALNQRVAEIDPYGHATEYTYDRFGNEIECIKPAIQDVDQTLIRPNTEKKYNALNQLISEKDENGFITTAAYNVYGNPTEIQYPNGNIERFAYTPSGKLKQKWHGDGTSIKYEYNPKGCLKKETFLDKNGVELKEETYIYSGPLLMSKKDAMQVETTYTYDHAGRKIKENIGGLKIIQYEYDDFGRISKIKKEEQQEVYEYDGLDRVISKTWQDNQGKVFAKEAYRFDAQGNQTEKTIWQTGEHLAPYHSSYYSDGCLKSKDNPLNQRYKYGYDHQCINGIGQKVKACHIFDPLERRTIEVYDSLGYLSSKELFNGDQRLSCTCYTYDAAGNCVKEHATIMKEGEPIRDFWIERRYNRRGWLKEEKEMPEGKTIAYQYDSMGRLKKKTKPDGVSISYTYDSLGRVETIQSSDGTVSYTYSYDLHDNMTQIQDHVHSITQYRSFDLWNRLEWEEISPGIIIHYDYDALDRLKEMRLPDGSSIIYTYDAYHLKKMQRFNAAKEQIYAIDLPNYNLRGHPLDIHSPAGVVHYTYDLLGRAIHIHAPCWESQLEQFDLAGNLSQMKQRDTAGTLDCQFTYDRFNHLTSESTGNQYLYDSIGNCLQKNDKARHINALNQLKNDGQVEYSYDANGNLKTQSSPAAVYHYDALNRLIRCDKEGEQTTFIYDAFGRCLSIHDHLGTKQLLYQGEQEIGSVVNGQLQEFRLVHPNPQHDLTFAIELQGQPFFPIQDFRGNICALRKHDGSVAQWTRYSAFGERVISGDSQDIFNPWRFANRREVSDLSLFTHRFYNPALMRWLTTDPLGFREGLNLYAYARNNPFYYKDPDGQFAVAIPLLTWVFGAGAVTVTLTEIAYAFAIAGTWLALNNVDKLTDKEDIEENKDQKEGKRKRLQPDSNATGAHTAIKRDPKTGEITHYETYKPQTNPKNPNNWENEKRYDGAKSDKHWNKELEKDIYPPHIHEPNTPGGVRPAQSWEIPLQRNY